MTPTFMNYLVLSRGLPGRVLVVGQFLIICEASVSTGLSTS
jgi:hypothetical protein